ncbi:thiamine-phosphate kinase [uncultured Actinomyces sp.]|uniref:thiamine-phosphate kinase n=1 Tax=uncultured Actinomyces sp. TaxID=249061 RepID=UPI0026278E09|nr:thiamine-phosphate kinase [uncultured Actinomyces sp.]
MSSEAQLIARMREVLPEGVRTMLGSGDDCALVAAPEGSFLVTTDALVEGQHFRRDWFTPGEIGARAAVQNLADIAACGGSASGLVVAMVIPPGSDEDWILEVVSGFGSEVAKTGAGVIGGDITSGRDFTLAVTAFGYCDRLVTRAQAKPGDVIAYAGDIGVSGVGLALLQNHVVNPALRGAEALGFYHYPLSFYRVPKFPLQAGPIAANAGATAMIDVSDGLGIDLSRIAKASKVSMRLSRSLLKNIVDEHQPWLDVALKHLDVGQLNTCELVEKIGLFNRGEDHALLATFPSDINVPPPFRIIGDVTGGEVGTVMLDDEPYPAGGWDHLQR